MNGEEIMNKPINSFEIKGGRQSRRIGSLLAFVLCAGASQGWADRVKVEIKDGGFYRIPAADLATAFSMTESQISGTPLRMDNAGRPVAILRDQGDVVFYAHPYESIYTDRNVYWLESGMGQPVPSMSVASATGQPQASFADIRRFEHQTLLRLDLVYAPGEDPWFWRLLISGFSSKQYTFNLDLPGVVPGSPAAVKVRVKGATESSGRYFHGAEIKVNGQAVGYQTFDGLEAAIIEASIPSGLLLASGNTLTVVSQPPPGTFYDSIFLDYAEIAFQRSYNAIGDQLLVEAQPGPVTLQNLVSPDAEIWKVSDRWMPARLSGFTVEGNGSTWSASFQSAEPARYAVRIPGSEASVDAVLPVPANTLKDPTNAIDYLMIVGPGLETAAQVLADHRAANGLRTRMVPVGAVFDAFNYGIRDGRAIKAFLGYARRQWAESPRYVTLVGDGSMDYRNYFGHNDSLVPVEPSYDFYGMYASDHRAIELDSTGPVEYAISRIPAVTEAELGDYIANLIAFETGGAWREDILIATDNADIAGNYIEDGNQLEHIVTGLKATHRADIDLLGASQTRQEFISGVESGKELTVYIGHGTSQQFAEEAIFTINDVNALTNESNPSIFMVLGCLSGGFGTPGFKQIGEALVTKRGASPAMLGAATYVNSADSQLLATQVMHRIYNEGVERLGDAWVDAKNLLLLYNRLDPVRGYQLLGDSALSMGAINAPRGLPAPAPGPGSIEEWENWAIPPIAVDLDLPVAPEDDTDGDGDDNWTEYRNGTDPGDPDSFLSIIQIGRPVGAGTVEVGWPAAHGRTYRLERSYSADRDYTLVADGIPAVVPLRQWEDSLGNHGTAFYRVVVED